MYRRLSLRARMLLLMGSALLLMSVILSLQTLHQIRSDVSQALRQDAQRDAALLGHALTELAVLRDFTAIAESLKLRMAQGDLAWLRYTNGNISLPALSQEQRHKERPEWFAQLLALDTPTASFTISLGGEHYGQVLLRMDPHAEEEQLWHLYTTLATMWSIGLLFMGLLMAGLLGINLSGLKALRDAAQRMNRGDWQARANVPEEAPPELHETGMAFDRMSERLGAMLTALAEQQRATDNAALVSETDLDGTITYVNDMFCQVSGFERRELVGQNHRIIKSDVHPPAFFGGMWRQVRAGAVWRGEVCNQAKNGRRYWVATCITPILGADGLPQKYLSIRFDITRRKQAEEDLAREKERWQVTLQSINDGVIVTDQQGVVVFINAVATKLLGVMSAQALQQPIDRVFTLIHEDSRAPLPNPALLCLQDKVPIRGSGQTLLLRADGTELAVQESAALISDGTDDVRGCVLVLHDDSERHALLSELRHLAYHDPLTGLANRRSLEITLERALRLAQDHAGCHAFCYIDLDQFKLVNDTCGHGAGDTLLVALVGLMKQCVPMQQYLARLGGDEFGLLLFDTNAMAAKEVAEKIIEAINHYRFNYQERSFQVGASVGIAEVDAFSPDIASILSRADKACYAAKNSGRNRVQIYYSENTDLRRIDDEMNSMSHLTRALADNRFELYRQRITALAADAGEHYEILLRLRLDDGAALSPGHFLPAAEHYNLAPRLDRWVITTLLEYLERHPQDTARYSINLSGQSLADDHLLEYVLNLLDGHHTNAQRIGFEITESAAIADLVSARRFIHGLKARGCQFYLDDFGTGMSSFAYLKHLPVDYIKIDGAFVRDLETEPLDRVIVNAIVQIGRDFQRKTIAEFVETDAVLQQVRELGVDYAQGYLIHQPEPLPA